MPVGGTLQNGDVSSLYSLTLKLRKYASDRIKNTTSFIFWLVNLLDNKDNKDNKKH